MTGLNDPSGSSNPSWMDAYFSYIFVCGISIMEGVEFYSTVQYSTVQYSTVKYSTVQYSTIKYNKYNTVR